MLSYLRLLRPPERVDICGPNPNSLPRFGLYYTKLLFDLTNITSKAQIVLSLCLKTAEISEKKAKSSEREILI